MTPSSFVGGLRGRPRGKRGLGALAGCDLQLPAVVAVRPNSTARRGYFAINCSTTSRGTPNVVTAVAARTVSGSGSRV